MEYAIMTASLLEDLHPDGPDEDLLYPVSGETGDDLPVGPLPLDRLDAPVSEDRVTDGPRTSVRLRQPAPGLRRAPVVPRRRAGRRDLPAAPFRTPPDGHGHGFRPAPVPRGARPPRPRAAAE